MLNLHSLLDTVPIIHDQVVPFGLAEASYQLTCALSFKLLRRHIRKVLGILDG